MSEWDRSDENGMELVNSAQYHEGLDQLWNALRDEDGNLDCQGKDVFTLVAEEIGDLRCLLKAQERHSAVVEAEVKAAYAVTGHFMDKFYSHRDALSIITKILRGLGWSDRAHSVYTTMIELAEDTIEGRYN